ncbi:MAG: hypothetical protein US96_C0055G0012 [Candidatus Woesebacteria bacterium GW2011_GWB1_38_5b]|uniref:RNA polymerase sigma-70 region 4 domain-containing protein n=1 Tax=Candidatus Woesebacteria bacterium GW2011_GWB1_38_5b TaxID=1618569 RepID=A0A0G0K1X2_9BACT|nr:MAG: hypothetical protein US96_C0055G0012 [Candidatus Woesebacteria bacterium GW2011_GWB1_38_5b]
MRSNQTLKYFSSFIKNIPDLTANERLVLFKRLEEDTHIKIGKRWNVTEGRVRQIEKAAIKKIRSKTHQLALFKAVNP